MPLTRVSLLIYLLFLRARLFYWNLYFEFDTFVAAAPTSIHSYGCSRPYSFQSRTVATAIAPGRCSYCTDINDSHCCLLLMVQSLQLLHLYL